MSMDFGMKNPKDIVKEGYDKISLNYRGDTFDFENSGYKRFLYEFEKYLSAGNRLLDLGCGCGIPVARHLAMRYEVLGVDLSQVQVDRAAALVPGAKFVCADMTELDLPVASFDAIVSFYAIIHVPLDEQFPLFQRMTEWLVDGGHLMVTTGHQEWTGTDSNWHGGEMYWSHGNRDTYQLWLEQLGCRIITEHFMPEGNGGHSLFIAEKRPNT